MDVVNLPLQDGLSIQFKWKTKKFLLKLHLTDGPSITWSIKGHVNSALEYSWLWLILSRQSLGDF